MNMSFRKRNDHEHFNSGGNISLSPDKEGRQTETPRSHHHRTHSKDSQGKPSHHHHHPSDLAKDHPMITMLKTEIKNLKIENDNN